MSQITEHTCVTGTHECFYLASGPQTGPLIIFVHGWPELSRSWRHQLPVLGGLGFRAIAPDMRGYGRSSTYAEHSDYAQRLVVGDLLALHDHLGGSPAIWVGHDWGSPSVWNIASHHPERCAAVANLCVPYHSLEYGLEEILPLIDRRLYPETQFPAGQWEYQLFYEQNFAAAAAELGKHSYNSVKALFRKGDPAGFGKVASTARVRQRNGWFGEAGEAPDIPRDADLVSVADLEAYAESLDRNGWFGPGSYYMNHDANRLYAQEACSGGHLDLPVLFIAAQFDYTCEVITSDLARPMRSYCSNLTEQTVLCGHWMAQEKPTEVNSIIARWLIERVPNTWPTIQEPSP